MSFLATLREDIQAVFDRDPAATSLIEVVLSYPGLHAIWAHRLIHALWVRRVPLLPRLLSQMVRLLTGIEIHPGATIGRRFFIDHGMGVVIGETTEIGDDVTLYHQVTLGGTGKQRGKRHPTLGDHVVVSAGASVLGAITIGDHVKIGAGAVVLKDVPPYSTVVGVPGRVVAVYDPTNGQTRRVENLPDPQWEAIRGLREDMIRLRERVRLLEEDHRLPPAPGDTALDRRSASDLVAQFHHQQHVQAFYPVLEYEI